MTSPCATDPRRVPSRPVRILQHEPLDAGNLQAAFHRTVAHLAAGDFRAADVKKLQPGPFYRAKLSDADRLIFRFGEWRGETCLILLEIVRHHAYAASRFLRSRQRRHSRRRRAIISGPPCGRGRCAGPSP